MSLSFEGKHDRITLSAQRNRRLTLKLVRVGSQLARRLSEGHAEPDPRFPPPDHVACGNDIAQA
jgi:hypothetical protein